jgi:thioredoxin-like negative regulator of GroEL
MIAPHLKEVATRGGQSLRVGKLDSDKYPAAASKYKVQGLPTILLFTDQTTDMPTARIEGAMTSDQLLAWLKQSGVVI